MSSRLKLDYAKSKLRVQVEVQVRFKWTPTTGSGGTTICATIALKANAMRLDYVITTLDLIFFLLELHLNST